MQRLQMKCLDASLHQDLYCDNSVFEDLSSDKLIELPTQQTLKKLQTLYIFFFFLLLDLKPLVSKYYKQ